MEQIPIRVIDFTDRTDKARHDQIEQLVGQMLDATQRQVSAYMDRDKNFYEHKCANLNRQIDQLVYELYGLTDEDIAIVEGE